MAMTMEGEVMLPAPRERVWAALNDPEVLRMCIPGVQELEKTGDTEFRATAKLSIGPVKATFKGAVALSDLDPPNGYTISGEGQGGIAGFAKGGANVRLDEVAEGTRLSYDVNAQIGGKIAQLGSRLVNGVAKRYADEFFANFARIVAPADEASPDQASSEQAPSEQASSGQ
ncbi:CoxG family protein [Arenibaculum pallidiluteum]|uniref:CoxG family protein n=1 Tax=Arenibaculum pallidiluteum TaxID=2812559 RepID=UPI001F1F2B1D|nr:carbon monoxide dehydrogenase subunit G [Arenibaculum pallidiluteum]